MEVRLRLWIRLLSVVLPVVGTNGLLRMLLVPITTDGGHGAGLPSQTYTEFGATLRIRVRERPGQIPTLGIMAPLVAGPITTPRPAEARLQDAAITPTYTPATPLATAAERPITRTPESWPEAALVTLAISIAARVRQIAAASFTIPTQTLVSLRAKTTFMPARTAPCTATTGRAATGRATAAAAGNPSTNPSQSCKPNNKCAARASSAIRISTRCEVSVAAPACAEAVGDASPQDPSPVQGPCVAR